MLNSCIDKIMRSYTLFLLIAVLFSSCDSFWLKDKHTRAVLKSEKGFIRGVEFDMTKEQVKKIEKDTLVEESERFLGYVNELNKGKDHLQVEYFFNEKNQLDQIMINYYLNEEDDVQDLIADLTEYFNKKIGPGKKDEAGWNIWNYEDKKGAPGNVDILLFRKLDNTYGRIVDLEIVKYYNWEESESQ
ncbi:MAG: hypothetical protein SFW35_06985 [Chitinophagales bacterium]|nr:hypothetical protein [Chitinophagales bacterium]